MSRLGDYIEFVVDNRGKTPPSSNNDKYELIETTSIIGNNKYVDFHKISKFVDADTYQNWFRKGHPHKGDLLISTVGLNIGNVSIINEERGCIAQNLVGLRPNQKKLNPDFLYYFLTQNFIQDKLKNLDIGSAQPSLKVPHLLNLKCEFPEIGSQTEIGSTLSSLDDRITLLRETNATLEAIAQALFKSWFVDFDPVHAKAQGTKPEGMDEQTAALFPDSFEESELGMVPAGWDYVSLKEVVSIFDSQRIPLAGQERAKRKGEYPYYGAAALMDYVDDYIFDGVFLLTGEDGSVADSNGYPITQYVWGKIWVNNHAHVLQGKDGVSTEHLMMFLKRTNIEPFMTGAVQAKLSQSNMWRIMFLKPPHQISESFGCVIEPLFAKLRHNTEKAQTLTNLRDTLLPRLISGQLRLPDVEEMVG